MSAKILRFSAALVCVLLISVTAYADVVGTWNISGISKQRISIKGAGSDSGRSAIIDQFVFGQGGSFSMMDLPAGAHTWGYVKKKFAVYLDNAVLETYWTNTLEDELGNEGIYADIENLTVTKNTFTGKENKDGTIKGKWTLAFEAYLYVYNVDRGFDMKVKTTTTFTGTRITGVDILGLESNQSEELSDENSQRILMEAVCSQIKEAIMAGEPMK
jgi:hypothetical protein